MASYGGISPVQWALRDLAGTIGGGLSDIGRNRLATEQAGLQRAITEQGLARQAKMDAYAQPGLELAAEKNKQALAMENEPVTLGSMAGDIRGIQYFTNVPKGLKRSPAEDIAEVFGAKVDTKEGSPTRGQFIRPDGTPVLRKDLRTKADQISAILLSHADQYHVYQDQLSRQHEKLSQNPELLKTPEGQKIMANMKNTVAWLDNPQLQLKTLMRQREILTPFEGKGEIYDKNLARIDNQIKNAESKISKAAEAKAKQAEESRKQAFEREKLYAEEAGKDRRAWLERQPKPTEPGKTREIKVGDEIHTQEWDGMKWKTIATGTGKPASGDQRATELQRNVPYVAKVMGVSEDEALKFLRTSMGKSDEQIKRDLYMKIVENSFAQTEEDFQRAKEMTEQAWKVIKSLGGEKAPASTGKSLNWRDYR